MIRFGVMQAGPQRNPAERQMEKSSQIQPFERGRTEFGSEVPLTAVSHVAENVRALHQPLH